MRDGWVADSFDEAARVFGEHYARMTRFYLRHGNLTRNPGFASPDEITPESVAPYIVMGEPQQCIEHLERLHEELGVDYVVFCCRLSTGPSLEETREQILRFGEEVVAAHPRPLPRPGPSRDPGRVPVVSMTSVPPCSMPAGPRRPPCRSPTRRARTRS